MHDKTPPDIHAHKVPGLPRLYDARALAQALGVSVSTIRVWTRDGQIPCVRLTGGTIRYEADALIKAFVDRRQDGKGGQHVR